MANETISSGSGLRAMYMYALDSAGYPDGDQSGATPYDGTRIQGIKTISLNIPEVQRIQHTGDDDTFAQDFLPPGELPAGTFTTGKSNLALDAEMSDTEVETLGEWEIGGLDTNKAGREIDALIAYYRQAILTDADDASEGARRWQSFFIGKTRITPQGNTPQQGGADENTYSITPTKTKIKPWGAAFTDNDNGFTRAVRLRVTAENPIMMYRYTGNATLTTFNTTLTPISVAKTKAFVNGAAATVASVDTGAKSVTLSVAPAHLGKVVIMMETADSIS